MKNLLGIIIASVLIGVSCALSAMEPQVTLEEVSNRAKKMIHVIYTWHGLSDEGKKLKFYVNNDKSMLPIQALQPHHIKGDKRVFMKVSSHYVILSPCLHNMIQTSTIKKNDKNIFELCTNDWTVFNLLYALGWKQKLKHYRLDQNEQLHDDATRFAFLNMSNSELRTFKTSLEGSNLEESAGKNFLKLATEELARKYECRVARLDGLLDVVTRSDIEKTLRSKS